MYKNVRRRWIFS